MYASSGQGNWLLAGDISSRVCTVHVWCSLAFQYVNKYGNGDYFGLQLVLLSLWRFLASMFCTNNVVEWHRGTIELMSGDVVWALGENDRSQGGFCLSEICLCWCERMDVGMAGGRLIYRFYSTIFIFKKLNILF